MTLPSCSIFASFMNVGRRIYGEVHVCFDRTRIIPRQLAYSEFGCGSVTVCPAMLCQPALYSKGKGAIFPAKV